MGAVTDAVRELAIDVRRWASDAASRVADAVAGAVAPERSVRDVALAAIVVFAVRLIMGVAGLFREPVPVTRALVDAAVVALPAFVLMVVILHWRDQRAEAVGRHAGPTDVEAGRRPRPSPGPPSR